jgi:hypothetical protein
MNQPNHPLFADLAAVDSKLPLKISHLQTKLNSAIATLYRTVARLGGPNDASSMQALDGSKQSQAISIFSNPSLDRMGPRNITLGTLETPRGASITSIPFDAPSEFSGSSSDESESEASDHGSGERTTKISPPVSLSSKKRNSGVVWSPLPSTAKIIYSDVTVAFGRWYFEARLEPCPLPSPPLANEEEKIPLGMMGDFSTTSSSSQVLEGIQGIGSDDDSSDEGEHQTEMPSEQQGSQGGASLQLQPDVEEQLPERYLSVGLFNPRTSQVVGVENQYYPSAELADHKFKWQASDTLG